MKKNSDALDEGEKAYYFIDESSGAELENFFPGISSLSSEELGDRENVPKKYPVTESRIIAAIEDEEIRDFKEANYCDIKKAGSFIDEVLYDRDNGRDLLEREIRNWLTEAYRSINQVRDRIEEFDPDSTHIIYTDKAKELLGNYLDEIEEEIEAIGEELHINVEKEFENREKRAFDPYTELDPSGAENNLEIDEDDSLDVKADEFPEPGGVSDSQGVEASAD